MSNSQVDTGAKKEPAKSLEKSIKQITKSAIQTENDIKAIKELVKYIMNEMIVIKEALLPKESYLSVSEFSEKTAVNSKKVRQLCKEGKLKLKPGHQGNEKYYIHASEIYNFVNLTAS